MQPPIQCVFGTLKARGKQQDILVNQQYLVSSKVKKNWSSTSRTGPTIIGCSIASLIAAKILNQTPVKTAAKNVVKDYK
jgi:hydroxymethylpyrimidine/phosphomethylpyrimidine kinase